MLLPSRVQGLSWDRGKLGGAGWTGRLACPPEDGLLQTGQGREGRQLQDGSAHPVYWALISAIIKSAPLSPRH